MSNSADKWQKISEEHKDKTTTQPGQPENQEGQLEFPSRQQLEDQLTVLERKVSEYKEMAVRAQAEMKNLQWRAERDISNAHKYGVEQLIKGLLPVVDALLRGMENCDINDTKVKTMFDGMKLTSDLLQKALTQFGVEFIDPAVGEPFDPKFHEAMGMQEAPGAKSNTIAKVLQKGFRLHDRVLRAAMVMVAA
ncbi:MAG: nucleotide exchange factor GrpE [Proteobacteria bacterium]|nr:nucleotide exchange factor GrpE [Pseudomonadota bacterium]